MKEVFKAEKIEKSADIILNSNIEKVFPLFGAFEERKWAEGWNPVLIYPSEEIIEEGTTFETEGYCEEKKYLWRIIRYEKERHLIQYLVSTENRYWTITVKCKSIDKNHTRAKIRYTFIGLNNKGNSLNNQALHRMFSKNLQDWEEEIKIYIKTSKL